MDFHHKENPFVGDDNANTEKKIILSNFPKCFLVQTDRTKMLAKIKIAKKGGNLAKTFKPFNTVLV